MLKNTKLSTGLLLLVLITSYAVGQDKAPFGDAENVKFAKTLWAELKAAKLVGKDRIHVRPFEGNEPHGSIQQVLNTDLTVNGRTDKVIVKINHGGPDVDVQEVYDNPDKHLAAVTVMFKREAGYDPDNNDWFWAKYNPDGSLDKNPKGMSLAGRVAKGMNQGCIACHTALGGEDQETLTSK